MVDPNLTILAQIVIDILYRGIDLFAAPLKNPDLFWILIPIYVNWVLSDFLSTKIEFSNAAITGFTYLWVGTNWIREYFRNLKINLQFGMHDVNVSISQIFTPATIFELIIVFAMFFYGLIIMGLAVRGRKVSKYLGDIRTATYLLIVLTPILFKIVPFDLITINAIILFGLIFFAITEGIYRVMHPAEIKNKGSEEKD